MDDGLWEDDVPWNNDRMDDGLWEDDRMDGGL